MEVFDAAELWSRERIAETQLTRLKATLAQSRKCSFYCERLDEAGYEEEIIYAELDPELVAKTRKTLPVLEALG